MRTINTNKIFSTVCLVASAWGLTSCSDSFFDRYSSDTMQMETYMKNDSEVENILLDAYYYLRNVQENVIMVNGLCTDEAYDLKKNNATDYISFNEGTWDASSSTVNNIWTYSYNMINRCNSVLDKIDHVSESNRKQFQGEASFFRAYAYFTLVRLFGAVPLTDHVIENYKDLYTYDRSSKDDVYAFIKADLAKAIEDLPESYSEANHAGRATKIAAFVILADVEMTLKDFEAAKGNLKEVIDYANQNPKKLGLLDDYTSIFDSENPINKEVILAAQFNNGSTVVDNYLMRACIPAAIPASQPAYVFPDGTKSTILTSQGNSCLLMTWELYNQLRSNPQDKRFTEMVYDKAYDTSQTKSKQTDEVNVNKNGETYIPTTLKYFDKHNQGLKVCASGCDDIIYRYADVLLMYAESLNETQLTAEAKTYLDKVRTRAGIDGTTAQTQEEIRLAIENERYVELCFEGHRWYDLVRTGRINTVMEAHFNHRVQGLSATLQASNNGMSVADCDATTGKGLEWRWSKITDDILFPIPYVQRQLSPNWEQNPGY